MDFINNYNLQVCTKKLVEHLDIASVGVGYNLMNGEIQLLATYKPIEFEK